MRTYFDNGIAFRQGGPFLGLNLPKLLQDLAPAYTAAKDLVKDQTAPQTVTPTAQPLVPRPVVQQPDNTMTYLVLGLLGLGGAGAAWYFFRKKKASKK